MSFRIVHYINQFFAGVGGEDKADFPPVVYKEPIGPGTQLQRIFGSESTIVATIVCGDNFFAEHKEEALQYVKGVLLKERPKLLIAGPSFGAGRYGFACGEVILKAMETLDIPGVAGMNEESPAVKMFSPEMFIVKTGNSARSMKEALDGMAKVSLKLLKGDKMKTAFEEGYFSRGIRKNFFQTNDGAYRSVEMLLKKMKGDLFISEYLQIIPEKVAIAPAISDLSKAKVAVCTTGGIVPIGNPDRIESSSATKFGIYSFKNQVSLKSEEFTSVHAGYDTTFAQRNPNRIVPVDVLREMENTGKIGELHENFYSTTGTGASLKNSEDFGKSIAEDLKKNKVNGVIMVST